MITASRGKVRQLLTKFSLFYTHHVLLSDLAALIAAGTYLLIYMINIINNNNRMEKDVSMDTRRFMKNMDNMHKF